jgi:hypothetical protein
LECNAAGLESFDVFGVPAADLLDASMEVFIKPNGVGYVEAVKGELFFFGDEAQQKSVVN